MERRRGGRECLFGICGRAACLWEWRSKVRSHVPSNRLFMDVSEDRELDGSAVCRDRAEAADPRENAAARCRSSREDVGTPQKLENHDAETRVDLALPTSGGHCAVGCTQVVFHMFACRKVARLLGSEQSSPSTWWACGYAGSGLHGYGPKSNNADCCQKAAPCAVPSGYRSTLLLSTPQTSSCYVEMS